MIGVNVQSEIETKHSEEMWWSPQATPSRRLLEHLAGVLTRIRGSFIVLKHEGQVLVRPYSLPESLADLGLGTTPRCIAYLPPVPLESLGSMVFCRDHRLRYAYVTGGMANGIASVELVQAMARAGMLGFFGAAGLDLDRIEVAIDRLKHELQDQPFGFNLIHSPDEPEREAATVSLYLRKGVRLAEAAAYLRLTLPVVRYRVAGIGLAGDGCVVTPNRIIAKVSRVEVATQFFSPPPDEFLNELVRTREITQDQARLASRIPMAQDVTAEADSAGHTDNRPLVALLPIMQSLRQRLQNKYGFEQVLRVGAAGGLSTPSAVAAALAMGAAYITTGSVNQACVESGSSDPVRRLLAQAEQADTAMAPAADMFEMGVKVQVLKRGTMFPMRAAKLYELYRAYPGLEALPVADRSMLEKNYFRTTLEGAWESTQDFFMKRDPAQIERAQRDPKHKMALVFRSYLALSSRWANAGEPSRAMDYQVWCGPAMGAFNEWVKGTFLERPENRRAADVALNLLYGAAVQLRVLAVRTQGIPWPDSEPIWAPLEPGELSRILASDE
jgi:PfaD family protein